jgi:putative oxidoreductase
MKEYGAFALRIGLGGFFVTAGILSIISATGVIATLTNLGFPIPRFFAWLLIFIELVCGAGVLVGYKIKYVTVPLALILFVAITTNPLGGITHPIKDAVLLLAVIALWLLGPGMWGLDRK